MMVARKVLTQSLTVVVIWTAVMSSYGLASKAHAALFERGANPLSFITEHNHAAVHTGRQIHNHERSSSQSDKQDCFYICIEAVSIFDVKEFSQEVQPPETKVVKVHWPGFHQFILTVSHSQKPFLAQGPPGQTGTQGLARVMLLNARIRK